MVRYGSELYSADVDLADKHPELRDENYFDYRRNLSPEEGPSTPSRKRSRVYGGSKYSKKRAGKRQR